ncbi:MAG: AAA family ATPase, partial [Lachnospiraceae bacterium]|nr:AAA family ATPase [Lachnospiraceae bacterium]
MSDMMRKLPIGIQDFESIIKGDFIYVDKTRYIYNLVHMGKPYFLSRPRRFGKSLLLSTIRAYWEGKKELFKGLDIEELEKDNPDAWQEYPVFYFDFNKKDFQRESALEEVLNAHLVDWEKKYDLISEDIPIEERFQNLIKTAYERTGKRVVILVDEYDKPLLEVITDNDLEEHNKSVFKGFFSTLKSYDRYIEFEFLTGVTKFSKVSIFSDLNHLRDISLSEEYADICGITEAELKNAFMPEVEAMAAKQK